MIKKLQVSNFIKPDRLTEFFDALPVEQPQINPPAIVQQVQNTTPAWITSPDTPTSIGAVGVVEISPIADKMMLREEAVAEARIALIQRLYKDAGITPGAININLSNSKVSAFFTDRENGKIYCRLEISRDDYNKLVTSLKNKK